MANEINIQLDPFLETGLTLVAKVFNKTGTQQGSDVSLTETSTGFYSGDFAVSGLADGDYIVKFQTATEFYGAGELKVKDGAEVIVPTKAELDAAQSSIEGNIAALNNISTADIRTELSTELSNLDVAVSTRLANVDYIAPDNSGIAAIQAITDQISFTSGNVNAIANTVADKTGYTLTTADKEAIATVVEASLLDENDGQKILEAIVNAIGNQNIDEIALVAAIRADLERAGGSIDALPLLSEIESSTVLAKEATLAALNDIDTAQVQTAAAAALTAYDAPTKAELDTAQTSIESNIAALNNLDSTDVQTAAAAALTAYDAPTKAELDTAQTSIESNIAALNNLNTSDVQTAAAAALTAYDAPTKAELDAAQASIESIVNALNDISVADVENALTNYGAATSSDVTGSTGNTQDSLVIINEGVKKASLLIPHTEDL
jgi:hypothetical protein